VNSLPEGSEKQKLQKFIDDTRSSLSNVEQTLAQLDNAADRSQLSTQLNQLKQQLGQLNDQLGNAHSLSSDPEVGAALSKVIGAVDKGFQTFSDTIKTADRSNQFAQGNWEIANSEVGEVFLNQLGKAFTASFEEALSRYATENNLSEEEVAQLRFAHFNPDSVTDPKIKGMMAEINTAALGMMSENWGIPLGFTPTPENLYFNAKIEQAFDDAMKQLLQGTDLARISHTLPEKSYRVFFEVVKR